MYCSQIRYIIKLCIILYLEKVANMDYINAREAAAKWGLSVRRVQALCEQGRVDGVTRLGNIWLIPKSSEKPPDGRTREIKRQKQFLK